MSEEIKNNNNNESVETESVSVEQTPAEDVEIVGVNFREAGKIYFFSPEGFKLAVGEKVIVETSRGVELGTVKVANKIISSSDLIISTSVSKYNPPFSYSILKRA